MLKGEAHLPQAAEARTYEFSRNCFSSEGCPDSMQTTDVHRYCPAQACSKSRGHHRNWQRNRTGHSWAFPKLLPKRLAKKAEQKRSHGFNSFQVCASAQQAIVSLPPLQHQTFSSLIPRLKLSQILTEQPLSKNTEAVA